MKQKLLVMILIVQSMFLVSHTFQIQRLETDRISGAAWARYCSNVYMLVQWAENFVGGWPYEMEQSDYPGNPPVGRLPRSVDGSCIDIKLGNP